ncbi:transaldolase family protein [Plantactinospora sp. WMMB334]|uniref:transaldolase family protein n=1 Tax=Plantactinospora sp. WMMB334 TaxID=3404119 RepID=UPI003B963D22
MTTNPTLMRRCAEDPLRHCSDLLAKSGELEFFYQPCGAYGEIEAEAWAAWRLDPERVTLKLMFTPAGIALARRLCDAGVRVALTAAQSPHAMVVAESIGCAAVIPYLDRAWRDPRTETHLVRALGALRRGDTQIVAASVKNVGQFTQAYLDGADAVSAPLEVLHGVLRDPAADEAEQTFTAEYAGTALRLP